MEDVMYRAVRAELEKLEQVNSLLQQKNEVLEGEIQRLTSPARPAYWAFSMAVVGALGWLLAGTMIFGLWMGGKP